MGATSFISFMRGTRFSGDFGGSPPNNQPLVGSGLLRFRGWLEGHYFIQLQPSSQGRSQLFLLQFRSQSGLQLSFSLPVPSLCLLWRLSHGRCLLPASASARWLVGSLLALWLGPSGRGEYSLRASLRCHRSAVIPASLSHTCTPFHPHQTSLSYMLTCQ